MAFRSRKENVNFKGVHTKVDDKFLIERQHDRIGEYASNKHLWATQYINAVHHLLRLAKTYIKLDQKFYADCVLYTQLLENEFGHIPNALWTDKLYTDFKLKEADFIFEATRDALNRAGFLERTQEVASI